MTDFKQKVEYIYKDEQYTVRDNGEVLRHAGLSPKMKVKTTNKLISKRKVKYL